MAKKRSGAYVVNVTQEDIDRAERGNSNKCAVTTAVKREIPGAIHVSTDIQTIRFSLPDDRKRLIYMTPAEVMEYVVGFDAGDELKPFSFKLQNPAFEAGMWVSHNGSHHTGHPKVEARIRTGTNGGTRVKVKTSEKRIPPMSHFSTRHYGMRRMRVNQTPETAETVVSAEE